MPREIYIFVQQRVQSLLSDHFEKIGTPIEAAEKSDYGDVDVLVASPKSGIMTELQMSKKMEILGRILGAERWMNSKPTMNFALPYPRVCESSSEDEDEDDGMTMMVDSACEMVEVKKEAYSVVVKEEHKKKPEFVQVDVHICKSTAEYEWTMFHQAHGDLWSILGSLIRHQGLTINDKGLFLRIPSIETVNRKKSMVFLSADPDRVLEFLELDKERWWRKFDSMMEMFDYVTTCRFFYVREEKDEEDLRKEELNANDRKRMKSRPVFKQWYDEYLPKLREKAYHHFQENREVGGYSLEPIPRETVMEMAFNAFGDGVRADYDALSKEWEKEEQKKTMVHFIKEALPPMVDPGTRETCGREWIHRCEAIKGLTAIILRGSTEFREFDLEDGIVDGEHGLFDLVKLRSFVERKWRGVGDVGLRRLHEKSTEVLSQKEKKKMERMESVAGMA